MQANEQIKFKVIELSNSSCNGTSSLLSIIVFVAFILFSVKMGEKIYNKLNPNDAYKDPNIFNAYLQDTMRTIQYLMGGITTKNMDDIASNYKTQLSDLKTTAQLSSNAVLLTSSVVSGANKIIYDNFVVNLGKLGNFLDNANGVIKKLSNISDNNIKNFENVYIAYQTKLQGYVKGMVSMMQKMVDQVQQASVIQPLFGMVTPMKRVFASIYDTLNNNLPFIKQFYPDFDINSTPKISANIQPNLGASFKTSSMILQQSGFK